MKADEKRITQLTDDPDSDEPLETDLPMIRAGLLVLNWVTTHGGRAHPFVSPASTAVAYLDKVGRLTPAHRRTLKGIAQKLTRADTEWVKAHILNQQQ